MNSDLIKFMSIKICVLNSEISEFILNANFEFPFSSVASFRLHERPVCKVSPCKNKYITATKANRLISNQSHSRSLSLSQSLLALAHSLYIDISFCFPFYLNWLLCQHHRNSIFSFPFDVLLFLTLAMLFNHNVLQ